MKLIGLLLLLGLSPLLRAQDEPVIVPNTISPDGSFFVRLTHDRAEETETKRVIRSEAQIVESAITKVLASFPYPAGTSVDGQPPHAKVRANWSPDGRSVAVSFAERFFTHLVVYRLKDTSAESKSFEAVSLPNGVALIQIMTPRFKQFGSHWHEEFQGWRNQSTIEYTAGARAQIEPLTDRNLELSAVYRFSVEISDPKTPIIMRVERVEERE